MIKGFALVSWDKLCRPKEMEGVGLRLIKEYQLALQAKNFVHCVMGATVTGHKYEIQNEF